MIRPGEINVQEIDAESIIAPVISRSQSTALYRNALSPTSTTAPTGLFQLGSAQDKRAQTYGRVYPNFVAREKTQAQAAQGKKSRPFFQVPSLQMPNVSLSNVSLPSFSGVNTRLRSKTLFNPRSGASGATGGGGTNSSFFADRASAFFGRLDQATAATATTNEELANQKKPRPHAHRRSSSHPSVLMDPLSRMPSAASSLGDDSKFLHIHAPANARFKAILDGLPTFPNFPQLPQLAQFNPFTDSVPETSANNTAVPPALEALDNVTGDVVIMGGYRGSILRDKTAGNRRVWIPLKVGFNLRKINLEVGLDPEDEENMKDKIAPSGMLTHIGPVDISKKLLKRLRSNADAHGRRVHEWGYDWRLSPELLSKRLIAFLEGLECNSGNSEEGKKRRGALVIAHSLGGLITRHAMNQRPDLFSGVVFAGTPQTCVNILGPLRNGDAVLMNSKVFTAQVNFTLRTSYAFLPESGECFVDRNTDKPLPLDFFNVKTWQDYCLSPCVSTFTPYPAPSTSTSVLGTLSAFTSTADLSKDRSIAPQTSSTPSTGADQHPTLPLSRTIPYLERTLAETLRFRKALEYNPEKEALYPPQAVLYSKTSPTVRGAKVDGLEGIKRADAYVDLLFGAGDGVCLAKKAMLPEGYRCAKRVAVDRGHIGLLGDLEGVGKCIDALVKERGW